MLNMTQLLERMYSIPGVTVKFKQFEGSLLLIFWKNGYPIADVYHSNNTYRTSFPEFTRMALKDQDNVKLWLKEYINQASMKPQEKKLYN